MNKKEIDESEVLGVLNRSNPWWKTNEVPKSRLEDFKRKDYYQYKDTLTENKEIIIIAGPRRVGKTIIIHQLIQNLLKEGVEAKRILYASLDQYGIRGLSLKDLLNFYSTYVLTETFDDLTQTNYIFLDEIQTLDGWASQLKNWYDYKYNLKFVVSGSSCMELMMGVSESLVGRAHRKILFPFKFSEIMRYNKIKDDYDGLHMREAFLEGLKKQDSENIFKALQKGRADFTPVEEKIRIQLNEYLLKGGYPELLKVNNYDEASRILSEKIKLTLLTDIVQKFEVRNPHALIELFSVLAKQSGDKINLSSISQNLGIERPTLNSYIEYLKDMFLISSSEYYGESRVTRIKKAEKVYVNDPGVRNATINYLGKDLITNPTEIGTLAEQVFMDHLRRLVYNLRPSSIQPEVFYWQHRGKEVDAVIKINKLPIPFEVKYRNKISGSDLANIKKFIEKHKTPLGVLITKDDFRIDGNIIYIPLWLFLCMV
jgi:hypothetical protein